MSAGAACLIIRRELLLGRSLPRSLHRCLEFRVAKSEKHPSGSTPVCVFCRTRPGTEGGHVVAKCFYLMQPAMNFPRVPACAECERGRIGATSWRVNDDEEYMAAI